MLLFNKLIELSLCPIIGCIEIKKTKIPLLAIILGTIGGIVLLGLILLLLWKLIVTAYVSYFSVDTKS